LYSKFIPWVKPWGGIIEIKKNKKMVLNIDVFVILLHNNILQAIQS